MNQNAISLSGRVFGGGSPPLIIAELSGNHGQSLETALRLVDRAADAGADAIKLQTYTADTMTLNCDRDEFRISDPESLWYRRNLYELYDEAHTPWHWHEPLFERAQELGMLAFSSAFDRSAVDFLDKLNVPCIKIASFEVNDLPLIQHAASTGRTLIISTGMASIEDIELALRAVERAGGAEPVLLKCTSHYPADARHANLNTMLEMRSRFDVPVGLSDHSLGIGVAVAATALGCCVIEKHLVLSRNSETVDAAFSMEPAELRVLTEECRRASLGLGEVQYGPVDHTMDPYEHRRSIYVAQDIAAGERLTESNLQVIRPGHGLPPRHMAEVLGAKAQRALPFGTALSWEDIEPEHDST